MCIEKQLSCSNVSYTQTLQNSKHPGQIQELLPSPFENRTALTGFNRARKKGKRRNQSAQYAISYV
jgi:hypothetical protein